MHVIGAREAPIRRDPIHNQCQELRPICVGQAGAHGDEDRAIFFHDKLIAHFNLRQVGTGCPAHGEFGSGCGFIVREVKFRVGEVGFLGRRDHTNRESADEILGRVNGEAIQLLLREGPFTRLWVACALVQCEIRRNTGEDNRCNALRAIEVGDGGFDVQRKDLVFAAGGVLCAEVRCVGYGVRDHIDHRVEGCDHIVLSIQLIDGEIEAWQIFITVRRR